MALNFNGSTQSAAVNLTSFGTPQLVTVSLWFYLNATPASPSNLFELSRAISSQNGFNVRMDNGSGLMQIGASSDTSGTLVSEATFGAAPASGAWHHLVAEYDGTQNGAAVLVGVWLDGVSQTLTAVQSNFTATTFGGQTLWYVCARNANAARLNAQVADLAMWTGVLLTQDEITALSKGVRPDKVGLGYTKKYWWPMFDAVTPVVDISGSGNINLGLQGTPTLATDPPILPLTKRPSGTLVFEQKATTASTEADDTLSASAKVQVKASFAQTEENDQAEKNGGSIAKVRVTGSVSRTEDEDTLSAAAKVRVTGSVATTEESDTLAASAKVRLTASLASTEENDASTIAAKVRLTASLASTEEDDALSAAAKVRVTTSAAVTEEDDTSAAPALVKVTGAVAATEEDDSLAASSKVRLTSSAAINEEDDFSTISAGFRVSTSVSVTEEDDASSAPAFVRATGTVSVTEEDDSAVSAAKVRLTASSNINEENDTLVSATQALIRASLAITEENDYSNIQTIEPGGNICTGLFGGEFNRLFSLVVLNGNA